MPDTGSSARASVIAWRRRPGDAVEAGEALCVVAWEGNTAEIESPASGFLRMLAVGAGQSALTGATLALIDVAVRVEAEPEPQSEPEEKPETGEPPIEAEPEAAPEPEADGERDIALVLAEAERLLAASEAETPEIEPVEVPMPKPVAEAVPDPPPVENPVAEALLRDAPVADAARVDLARFISPAVRRFGRERGIDPEEIAGSGRGGRVTLEDVRSFAQGRRSRGGTLRVCDRSG